MGAVSLKVALEVARKLKLRKICPPRPSPSGKTYVDEFFPLVGYEPCKGHDFTWLYLPDVSPPTSPAQQVGQMIARKALDMALSTKDRQKVLRGEKLYCRGGVHKIYMKPEESRKWREVVKEVIGYEPDDDLLRQAALFWLCSWRECPYRNSCEYADRC